MACSCEIHLSLKFPSPCNRCGTLSGGILNYIPNNPIPYALARDHYIPETTERSQIEALIASCQTFRRTAQAEISTLKWCVSDTQAYEDLLHSLISPMNKMPNDILGEIFSHLCQCDDFIDVSNKYDQIWVLRQVCTRWRKVVDSRSLFWRNMKVGILPNVIGTELNHRVRTFIENSREAQLRVSFCNEWRGWGNSVYDGFRDILDESDRWISLETTTNVIHHPLVQKSLQSCSLANLRKLSLQSGYVGMDDGSDHFSIFHGSTSIAHLKLEHIYFPVILVKIPMNNLRRLILKNCSINPFEDESSANFSSELNSKLSSLEELTWDSCDFHGMPSMEITFPSLHTLSFIHNNTEADSTEFWKILHVPKLINLKLDLRSFPNVELQPILSMITRSKCFIKRLEVSSITCAAIYVINELSDVEELTLSRMDLHPVIQSLIWDPKNDKNALPSLRKLDLELIICEVQETEIFMHLTDFLRSRSHNTTDCHKCLTTVDITAEIGLDIEEAHVALKHLELIGRECGIAVTVTCSMDGTC
ncbi:hypothetical protein BDQ17DRAFT_1433389 [Cyathus striatus]|nr:hypothetical protein BDQ17DRAFT_1433389 [Cyathus striatus]